MRKTKRKLSNAKLCQGLDECIEILRRKNNDKQKVVKVEA